MNIIDSILGKKKPANPNANAPIQAPGSVPQAPPGLPPGMPPGAPPGMLPMAPSAPPVGLDMVADKLKDLVATKETSIRQINDLNNKTKELSDSLSDMQEVSVNNSERLNKIEADLEKFLSLYEFVTNQINPFVEDKNIFKGKPKGGNSEAKTGMGALKQSEEPKGTPEDLKEGKGDKELIPPQKAPETPESGSEAPKQSKNPLELIGIKYLVEKNGAKKAIEILESTGNLTPELHSKVIEYDKGEGKTPLLVKTGKDMTDEEKKAFNKLDEEFERIDKILSESGKQEAAPEKSSVVDITDAMPLLKINKELGSLVTVLRWVNYLVGKAGKEGARKMLRYYIELGWISSDVYSSLLSYIEGVSDNHPQDFNYESTAEDHATSLFFISKLLDVDIDEESYKRMAAELEPAKIGEIR